MTKSGDMMDSIDLRVVTLNCWGLKGPLSKDRKIRMQKIGQELAKGKYDIIALQEVWSYDDFEEIRTCIADVIKYSHYFHSGYIGSGVCVFSRYRIESAHMHRYSLNGFAHHIHRGDWFGGKVVGLAQIAVQVPGVRHRIQLNLYTTHIHAEYDRVNDLYLPHRVVQSYELSQFIKHTAAGADMILLMGDMNFEPIDLGYRIVLNNAKLFDAYDEAELRPIDEHQGNTCDRPDNMYTHPSMAEEAPNGKRIDYILYRAARGIRCVVRSCGVCLNRVPDTDSCLCYSDHSGVTADFNLQFLEEFTSKNDSIRMPPPLAARSPSHTRDGLLALLDESIQTVERGEKRVQADFRLFLASSIVLLFVFVLTIDLELTYPVVALPAIFCRFVLTIMVGFCFWYGVIGLQLEGKALKAAKAGMSLLRETADAMLDPEQL